MRNKDTVRNRYTFLQIEGNNNVLLQTVFSHQGQKSFGNSVSFTSLNYSSKTSVSRQVEGFFQRCHKFAIRVIAIPQSLNLETTLTSQMYGCRTDLGGNYVTDGDNLRLWKQEANGFHPFAVRVYTVSKRSLKLAFRISTFRFKVVPNTFIII